ncbi:MAG: aminotransferase class I/II-fold pyridoxal phosphate-dependent enzyme [Candidatus Obscuribacterales bacterium]|nr:aminotransferase class I/II-fold pyridoxal phosphate-dependent enzyme [Candidatus Obscuribacterales bacterium]
MFSLQALREHLKRPFDTLARYIKGQPRRRSPISDRALIIRESNIRDAARLVSQLPGITNLGQGLPEYPAPQILKDAAIAAINTDWNQYSNTWGYPQLREAIARKMKHYNGIDANPETEITVTVGASEALNASLLATVNPGDEVIIFEPFYENYHPNVAICGGTPRYVKLHSPSWTFDRNELAAAFNKRTRVILINTPHNPTGRVFTMDELSFIADLCKQWDVLAITDEIYEYMVYDGRKHISMATLPGMRERTITISGLSKTFSITGWRLGYAVAPEKYTRALRRVHDYLTLAAPSPMQIAGITALNMPDEFYAEMVAKYQQMRDQICLAAKEAGFEFAQKPEGTYYLFTDPSKLGFENDRQLWEHLLYKHKLATVAGYCFFRPDAKTNHIRFCYAKSERTIAAAKEKLISFRDAQLAKQ